MAARSDKQTRTRKKGAESTEIPMDKAVAELQNALDNPVPVRAGVLISLPQEMVREGESRHVECQLKEAIPSVWRVLQDTYRQCLTKVSVQQTSFA